MTSILTNNGAMVALQTLKGINNDLQTTQSQISTGKKVADASDNAAAWAISKTMEADVSAFNKIQEGLGVAQKTVATARTASENIVEKLREIKDLTAQATNDTLNADQRSSIEADINSKIAEINSQANAAQFNGVNLANGGKAEMSVLSSLNRDGDGTVTPAFIDVTGADLRSQDDLGAAAGDLADLEAIDVSDATTSQAALESMDAMIEAAVTAATTFGTAQNQLESQSDFISQLSDNMKAGIGELVDADMEEASARLKALQTQQQLGTQALSIANQAPQSVLSLFQ